MAALVWDPSAAHPEGYTFVREDTSEERRQGALGCLRQANNFIKEVLISRAASLRVAAPTAPLVVVDVCCGRGGDLPKLVRGGTYGSPIPPPFLSMVWFLHTTSLYFTAFDPLCVLILKGGGSGEPTVSPYPLPFLAWLGFTIPPPCISRLALHCVFSY